MNRHGILWLTMALSIVAVAAAQPPDPVQPGDETRAPRWPDREERLDRMIEYLELSDAQAEEWRAIIDRLEADREARHDRIADLRSEFRRLAEQENPNLEEAGRIALELHREMESMRPDRDELVVELQAVLTPEQLDRFEAVRAARELVRPPGGRHERPRRPRPDTD